MSAENRKKEYDRLVEADELYKDDGALKREFGTPVVPKVGSDKSKEKK